MITAAISVNLGSELVYMNVNKAVGVKCIISKLLFVTGERGRRWGGWE